MTDKRGISALLLQRQLGLRRYETAWRLLDTLRRSMVNAVREQLHGDVEIDDTWVGGEQPGLRESQLRVLRELLRKCARYRNRLWAHLRGGHKSFSSVGVSASS